MLDENWDVIVVDAPSGTDSSPPLAALYTLARWFGLPGLVSGFVSPGMRHAHLALGGLGGLGLSHTGLMRLWFGMVGRMGAIWSSHLLARSRDDGSPVRTTNQTPTSRPNIFEGS